MKVKLTKIIVIAIIFLSLISCNRKNGNDNNKTNFPLNENELLAQNDIGVLLEYAIFDTNKIDFVSEIICGTLKNKNDFAFSKMTAIINDSSYFFYHFHERTFIDLDYIGMIFLDVNNPDTLFLYSYNWKYHTSEFGQILKYVSEQNKCSVKELICHKKVGKYFVPNVYFFVEFNSFDCSDGFVKKVIEIEHKVNSLFKNYIETEFIDEEILIKPYLELEIKIN